MLNSAMIAPERAARPLPVDGGLNISQGVVALKSKRSVFAKQRHIFGYYVTTKAIAIN